MEIAFVFEDFTFAISRSVDDFETTAAEIRPILHYFVVCRI